MTFWYEIIGGVAAVILLVAALFFLKRRPRKLNVKKFQIKWRDMQKLLGTKDTWAKALITADDLLADALKRRRFAGKTVGERLTKAQHTLTDNEGVWFGHKLRNKLDSDPAARLKEKEVKQALLGIRQALKDLGALPDGK